jgi:hypothetical protein
MTNSFANDLKLMEASTLDKSVIKGADNSLKARDCYQKQFSSTDLPSKSALPSGQVSASTSQILSDLLDLTQQQQQLW